MKLGEKNRSKQNMELISSCANLFLGTLSPKVTVTTSENVIPLPCWDEHDKNPMKSFFSGGSIHPKDIQNALNRVEQATKKKSLIGKDIIRLFANHMYVFCEWLQDKNRNPIEEEDIFWTRSKTVFDVMRAKLKWKQSFRFKDEDHLFFLFCTMANLFEVKKDHQSSLKCYMTVLKALVATTATIKTDNEYYDVIKSMHDTCRRALNLVTHNQDLARELLRHIDLIIISFDKTRRAGVFHSPYLVKGRVELETWLVGDNLSHTVTTDVNLPGPKTDVQVWVSAILSRFNGVKMTLLIALNENEKALKVGRDILKQARDSHPANPWTTTYILFSICKIHEQLKNDKLAAKVNRKVMERLEEFHKEQNLGQTCLFRMLSLLRCFPNDDPMHARFFELVDNVTTHQTDNEFFMDVHGKRYPISTEMFLDFPNKKEDMVKVALLDCIDACLKTKDTQLDPQRILRHLESQHECQVVERFFRYLDFYAMDQCHKGDHFEAVRIWETRQDISKKLSVSNEQTNLSNCYFFHLHYHPEALELVFSDPNRFAWNEKDVLEKHVMEVFIANGKLKEALTMAKALVGRKDATVAALKVFMRTKKYKTVLSIVNELEGRTLRECELADLALIEVECLLKEERKHEAFLAMTKLVHFPIKGLLKYLVFANDTGFWSDKNDDKMFQLITKTENLGILSAQLLDMTIPIKYSRKLLNMTRTFDLKNKSFDHFYASLRISTHIRSCF